MGWTAKKQSEILRNLQKLTANLLDRNASNGDWTKAIKHELVRQGQKLGYEVAASGCEDADYGEWLFDVSWLSYEWKADGPERCLKRLHLAAESEWGDLGAIYDDFEKLLVAKADVCLMIFQEKNAKAIAEVARLLGKSVKSFQGGEEGGRHLLLGYDLKENTFRAFRL